MANCYICDGNIDEPKLDPRDMKLRPCSACEDVIQETLEGFEMRRKEVNPEFDGGFVYLDSQLEEYLDSVCQADLDHP